ncbi:restriction endonuclease subunit S [Leptospira selangorensis]|uniref:Restriction endonuclease subunit S n=1 Tax=Leptospira selangorensis TaxID=2484982 RepID=A0A5F2BZ65_9LEPT|nr:restriction endonuclease subunit S [Leptospira selangorensis]TGM12097.1 restriction endonuclease subunit S [Leptospira selangorensis]TGM14860.1 restriction endonuclease subunit S [Leptospira selangorensis]
MKRYDKYKDSGVDWIGDIPEGWEVKKGQSLFNIIKKTMNKVELNKFFVYHYSIPSVQDTNDAYYEDGKNIDSDKFIVKGGELLYSKLNPRKETLVITKKRNAFQVCSTEFLVIEPIKINLNFIFHLFKSHFLKEEICSTVQSATKSHQRANPGEIHRMYYPFPPFSEQEAIADYLDKKISQIDQLIEKKKRLIELLQEERTAIINQAVTKGLNSNVKFNDSGIDWLGEIPEHWEVKKLKWVLNNLNSLRIPLNADERGRGEKIFDYYGASGVIDKVQDYLFNGEYILVGEDGANLLTRNTPLAFIAKGKFWVNNHAHILQQKYGSIEFFTYLLESMDFAVWVSGSAQPKLTLENLMNILISFPGAIEEQQAIVLYVKAESQRIDYTISKINREIELLQEYRTALISEVVMGKVKVI